MANAVAQSGGVARALTLVAAGVMLSAALVASPVLAQQAKDAKKAAPAPAAAAPAAGGEGAKSAWVKLCEKAQMVAKAKDGKDAVEEKQICLTHHERLDGNSGFVLVSAAIRQVEGVEKQHLMIMVPLGMALQAGVRAAVYDKDTWAKAAKNEKVDESKLKLIQLQYALCHPGGCTAEVEASKELIEQMKTGGGLMVLAVNAGFQPIGFPVPLAGFAESLAGKPVDNEAYAKARGQLMGQIRQRQAELLDQYRKEQEAQATKGAPAAAPAKK